MARTLAEVSLSTMWASGKHDHMAEFVCEARDYGFAHVELNPILSPRMLEELLGAEGISVSSVHCPCPSVLSSRGVWCTELSLSALDREAREEAVGFAERTIDLASDVGARVVIIHAGRVEINTNLEARLRRLYEEGLDSSQEYTDVKACLIEERRSKEDPYFRAARESLRALSRYSSEKGILIGLENRVHFHEIPSLEEMGQLLAELDNGSVGYWHDVGHAEVQSRLGFTPRHEWFPRVGDRMIGVHLHDVIGVRDHYAPGMGSVPWDMVAANLPPNVIKVCEVGGWNQPTDACRTVSFLEGAGFLE